MGSETESGSEIKIKSVNMTKQIHDAVKVKLKTLTPTKKGQHPITFREGGLHASTNTPPDQKIPAAKKAKALAGGFGPKAKQEAQFAKNVLTGRKKK